MVKIITSTSSIVLLTINYIHKSPHAARINVREIIVGEEHLVKLERTAGDPVEVASHAVGQALASLLPADLTGGTGQRRGRLFRLQREFPRGGVLVLIPRVRH